MEASQNKKLKEYDNNASDSSHQRIIAPLKTIVSHRARKPELHLNLENLESEMTKRRKDVRVLRFSRYSQLNDMRQVKALERLVRVIKSQKAIEELEIDFARMYFSEIGLKNLGECLEKLTSLKRLLKLKGWIKNLGSLENLQVELSINSILTQNCLKELNKGLKRIEKLKSLYIDTSYCAMMSNRSLVSIKQFKSLEKLRLQCFRSHYLLTQDTKMGAGKFTNLKSLDLDFSGYRKSRGQGLEGVLAILNRVPSLRSFKMGFSFLGSEEEQSNQALNIISEAFKNHVYLESLDLNFSKHKKITCVGVKKLVENLKGLTLLKHLKIDFSECSKIKNESIIQLSKVLKNFLCLQSVDLQFLQCKEITDLAIENVVKSLQGLLALKKLALSFTGANQSEILKSLENCQFLEDLTFSRSQHDDLENKDVIQIVQSLTRIKTIKTLYLNFNNCVKLTSDVLSQISQELTKLESVPDLELNFWRRVDRFESEASSACLQSLQKAFPQQKFQIQS